MDSIRLAIVGLGNMGYAHVQHALSLKNVRLAALCDVDHGRLERALSLVGNAPDVASYTDYALMLDKSAPDAVLIAVPHYDHTPMAIEAFARGIHVLVEKPVAVHGRDVRRMIAAHEEACLRAGGGPLFAAMFQQRTYGHWQKIKSLIEEGELGRLVRATWIITDWFRTQTYYSSGGWRATWKGEGGGVLLNQCPHNLDLFQWFVGMPDRITGYASIGKYHTIEVEDEVTAYCEYRNGLVAHFVTSTGESPGTNRLEIVGENGKLVFENNELVFHRNRVSMLKFIESAAGGFDKVETWTIRPPYSHHGESGHRLVIENFANAVLKGEKLIAPAAEGLNSVLMANAVLFSSLNGHRPVDIPMDEAAFEALLEDLKRKSTFVKKTQAGGGASVDMSRSYT